MTEVEALQYLSDVPRETMQLLDAYRQALITENERQNLISRSTVDHIWARHMADSAQILHHALPGSWLDLGSGAGFPGLVVAAIGRRPIALVESRTRRAAFLRDAAALLHVEHLVQIFGQRLETVPARPFATISARAFAPLDRLFAVAHPFSVPETRWILPKGRSAARELEAARGSWQGDFRIVPSITDPESAIIVASDVRSRARR